MICVDKGYADRLITCLEFFAPALPSPMTEKLQLLKAQLENLSMEKALLVELYNYINKYVIKRDDSSKAKDFFEERENGSEESELARELDALMNIVVIEQGEISNINYRGIRR